MTKENRQYRNSLFVDLFYEDESADENDIALYNALHDEPLPEGTTVERIRVENTLYMNFRNDISFGVQGKLLVFGEHQSTINENMPLRSLMYVGRAMEQIVPVRNRYRKKLVKLPTPEFYTFYNGEEEFEKEKILRLSDAFLTQTEEPMLELQVKVININHAKAHEILKRCPVLDEYSRFVEVVRRHRALGGKDAMRRAVEESMAEGILVDYLKKKGSEAVNMLMAEYDYDMDIEVQREEAEQIGYERGAKEGYSRGEEAGYDRGEEAGFGRGKEDTLVHQIKKKLARGKEVAVIADELEESEEEIRRLMEKYGL